MSLVEFQFISLTTLYFSLGDLLDSENSMCLELLEIRSQRGNNSSQIKSCSHIFPREFVSGRFINNCISRFKYLLKRMDII